MGSMNSIFGSLILFHVIGSVLSTSMLLDKDRTESLILLTAFGTTYKVNFKSHVHKWNRLLLWWRVKLRVFHLIMTAVYIAKNI